VNPPAPDGALTMPDGTSFVVVESDAERIDFEVTMAPGAMGPPRHFHPTQEESWTVLEGELSVLVGKDWRSIAAGESLSLAPGPVHTLRNRSTGPVRFRDTHVPALDFQQYMEDLDRLTASGHLTSAMTPRTLIYGSMALTAHRPMQMSASRVQRAAETLLAIVGRRLGYGLPVRPQQRP
jgi:quercetin dioxygenase-like cupin family protein